LAFSEKEAVQLHYLYSHLPGPFQKLLNLITHFTWIWWRAEAKDTSFL